MRGEHYERDCDCDSHEDHAKTAQASECEECGEVPFVYQECKRRGAEPKNGKQQRVPSEHLAQPRQPHEERGEHCDNRKSCFYPFHGVLDLRDDKLCAASNTSLNFVEHRPGPHGIGIGHHPTC